MKSFLFFLFLSLALPVGAQKAYDVTRVTPEMLSGRLLPSSEGFSRVPLAMSGEFTDGEKRQASRPVGLFLAFRTSAKDVGVIVQREGVKMGTCSGPVSTAGFDMYIRKDRDWLWAGSVFPKDGKPSWVVRDMAQGEKECLLYLPLGCVVKSLEICHSEGSSIELIKPFRHNVAVFGSSYTEGAGTTRPGATWSAQLTRMTGTLFANFGFSGNSKLQPYFADILAAMDVDAYLVDAFSNPTPEQIRDRLLPFIGRIRASRPDAPIIFLKTLYRERRNFDTAKDAYEARRMAVADSMMRIAVKQYDNVHWITTTNAADKRHETTVDGSHPSDHGYTLWAESVAPGVMKALKKGLKNN